MRSDVTAECVGGSVVFVGGGAIAGGSALVGLLRPLTRSFRSRSRALDIRTGARFACG